jgi:hypothetical protein
MERPARRLKPNILAFLSISCGIRIYKTVLPLVSTPAYYPFGSHTFVSCIRRQAFRLILYTGVYTTQQYPTPRTFRKVLIYIEELYG